VWYYIYGKAGTYIVVLLTIELPFVVEWPVKNNTRQHNGQNLFVFVQITMMAIDLSTRPNIHRGIRTMFCL